MSKTLIAFAVLVILFAIAFAQPDEYKPRISPGEREQIRKDLRVEMNRFISGTAVYGGGEAFIPVDIGRNKYAVMLNAHGGPVWLQDADSAKTDSGFWVYESNLFNPDSLDYLVIRERQDVFK